jgi:hypothetical protein|tara:strand:- start:122 stop:238 length:117 start_codon:yes stop_codon:yes gene_type:complete
MAFKSVAYRVSVLFDRFRRSSHTVAGNNVSANNTASAD